MKEIVLNAFRQLTDTLVHQLTGTSASAHHADAAQAQDAPYADAIALRARELHAARNVLTDTLALVRVLQTHLVAELEAAAPAVSDDAVRAKLVDVRDALLDVRNLGTAMLQDPVTSRLGELMNLRAMTAGALAALESLGVPMPAEAPAEAKQRLETAHARVQADHTDHTDRADRGEAVVTMSLEEACLLRGLLRRARTWVDYVPGLDGDTRLEGNELSASLQATADQIDTAIEAVSPAADPAA